MPIIFIGLGFNLIACDEAPQGSAEGTAEEAPLEPGAGPAEEPASN